MTDRRGPILHEEFLAVPLPIWREALLGIDWISLRRSPAYRGLGLPRGDGSAVVLIPGFLGPDLYLWEMFAWLRRVGYCPYWSGIGLNAECPQILTGRLLRRVERAQRETGRRVHLVGHSLGGVLARAAAVCRPELVASVITMASPFRAVRAHPFVLQLAALVRWRIRARRNGPPVLPQCYSGYCTCDFLNALRQPFPESVPQVAIYTRGDGVVDWRCCINDDPTTNIEVPGTHVGLVFNPQVYRHVAVRLALVRQDGAAP